MFMAGEPICNPAASRDKMQLSWLVNQPIWKHPGLNDALIFRDALILCGFV